MIFNLRKKWLEYELWIKLYHPFHKVRTGTVRDIVLICKSLKWRCCSAETNQDFVKNMELMQDKLEDKQRKNIRRTKSDRV